MDIIIFSGQSNMQGSTSEKDNSPAVSNCYEYLFLTNELVPLKNPVGEDIGDKILWRSGLGNGSLVPYFCKEYFRKTNKEVVAIHVAKGDSSMREWQNDTERFSVAIEKIKAGISKVKEKAKVDKIYFVWLQGESDALNKTGTENYLQMLIALKNDIKKQIPIEKFCIIKVGHFAEFANWVDLPKEEKRKEDYKIMKAQELAPKVDKDFVLLTRVCTKLSLKKKYLNEKECGPHYNNSAMAIIGKKAGSKLSSLDKKLSK